MPPEEARERQGDDGEEAKAEAEETKCDAEAEATVAAPLASPKSRPPSLRQEAAAPVLAPTWLDAGVAAALFREAAAVLVSLEPAGQLCCEICELLSPGTPGSDCSHDHDSEGRLLARAQQRAQRWLPRLDTLAGQLEFEAKEADARAQRVNPRGVLEDARFVCSAAGPAVQRMQTDLGAAAAVGALTLQDELEQFAADVASGACGGRGGPMAGPGMPEALSELWAGFGGAAKGYASFVEEVAKVPCPGEALGAGAAWRRLLAEVEVALLLAHLGGQAMAYIGLAQAQAPSGSCGGLLPDGVVARKVMMSVVLPPLQRRARYVAARVQWWLRRQAALSLERMRTPAEHLPGKLHSPTLARCRAALCSGPAVASLVEEALDVAAAAASAQVLSDLDAVLAAGCLHPRLLLLPGTRPDEGLVGLEVAPRSGAKRRVLEEMQARASVPAHGTQTRALVAACFRKLRTAVAGKAVGLALVAQAAFANRLIDEAARSEQLGSGRCAALTAEHERLTEAGRQAASRASAQGWLRDCEA
ncbi:unnamed protein product [Prorocentrum cordatum]|uniref:Uncharacterized protein n=1 Tax=Prorocentrum cordatum TaxID=2364126 RepID=A0ABN9P924_9DINO|nr:unnamed protein product [Polarella glacialis]